MKLERFSFSGHQTFPFRYPWLKKAVDGVEGDAKLFGRDDAMVKLGVGKNMVSSIRHWAMVCGVIDEDESVVNNRGRVLVVTDFGRRMFGKNGWDPYLEDPATPWLLHWRIASVPDNATTWYWAFNHLSQLEFSKGDLARQLMDLAREQTGARLTEASLSRDIDAFLRTYVAARLSKTVVVEDTLECPLVEIGLIRELEHRGTYMRVRDEHATLPNTVFAHALVEFVGRSSFDTKTVSLDKLAFAPGSPGRVFSLSEDGLVHRLEKLRELTKGTLTFDETAGLRQVLVKSLPDANDLLELHYGGATKRRGAEA